VRARARDGRLLGHRAAARRALSPQRPPPHVALAAEVELTDAHFARWLALWTATVEERHAGPRAELAKTQAARIAGSIHRRVSGAQASEHASIQLRHPGLEPS
jgi:hypothetical protein